MHKIILAILVVFCGLLATGYATTSKAPARDIPNLHCFTSTTWRHSIKAGNCFEIIDTGGGSLAAFCMNVGEEPNGCSLRFLDADSGYPVVWSFPCGASSVSYTLVPIPGTTKSTITFCF
jgi:hypothetical protein